MNGSDPTQAIAALEKSLILDPSNFLAYLALAHAYELSNSLPKALSTLRELASFQPPIPDLPHKIEMLEREIRDS